jgi:hypothetical protein
MISRPDILSEDSPEGIEVYQLTQEALPSCHVYMEAQVFAPDSSRFLLHRSATPHGSNSDDPGHCYLLCDVETGSLTPVTDELGATSPSVSPDGRYIYYFITQSGQYSDVLGGRITLRRRNLDGSEPVDILTLDGRVPGTKFKLSRLYPLSTISSDGNHLAISGFLGDGKHEGAPWGLWVIDLQTGESWLPVVGPTWTNMHPQYCRSKEAAHDIMIQENHGALVAADGSKKEGVPGQSADVHVIRDDGQDFRSLPWGRVEGEYAQGHQCWRGQSKWAITSTITMLEAPKRHEGRLVESESVPFSDHAGAGLGGIRNRLCQGVRGKLFSHFATDESGSRLIADCLENPDEFLADENAKALDAIYLMFLGEAGKEPARNLQFLLRPKATWRSGAHAHPFLSPNGRMAFFNSDESGTMQAYMIKNIPAA